MFVRASGGSSNIKSYINTQTLSSVSPGTSYTPDITIPSALSGKNIIAKIVLGSWPSTDWSGVTGLAQTTSADGTKIQLRLFGSGGARSVNVYVMFLYTD